MPQVANDITTVVNSEQNIQNDQEQSQNTSDSLVQISTKKTASFYAIFNGNDNNYYYVGSEANFGINDGILYGSDLINKYEAINDAYIDSSEYSFPNISLGDYSINDHYSKVNLVDTQSNDDIISYLYADDKQEFFVYYAYDNINYYGYIIAFGERSNFSSLPSDGVSLYAGSQVGYDNFAEVSTNSDFQTPTAINWKYKNLLNLGVNRYVDTSGYFHYDIYMTIGNIYSSKDSKAAVSITNDINIYDQNIYQANIVGQDGYIFGSEHQGLGVGLISNDDNLNYTYATTHGEYRTFNDIPQVSPTTFDLTGFINDTTSSSDSLSISFNSNSTPYIDVVKGGGSLEFGGELGSNAALINTKLFAVVSIGSFSSSWLLSYDGGNLCDDGTLSNECSFDGISWGFWGQQSSIYTGSNIDIETWVASIDPADDIASLQPTGVYRGVILGDIIDSNGNVNIIDTTNSFISMGFGYDATNGLQLNSIGLNVNGTDIVNDNSPNTKISTTSSVYNISTGSLNLDGSFFKNGKYTAGGFHYDDGTMQYKGVYKAIKQP